jgi:hypothetical protein
MIIVEVDGVKKEVPSSYTEMKVSDFIGYWKILHKYDLTQEDDIIKRDSDEMDCTLEIVARMLDVNPKEAIHLPYDKCNEIVGIFNNMLNREKFDADYSGWSFVHNGESYWFPKLSLDKMTFGEYAEVKQLEAIIGKDVANRFDFIPQQMAILCRRKNEKKEEVNREEREKDFESLTMDIIMRFAFFLSKWNKTLSQSTLISMANLKESEEKLVTS